MHYFDTPTSKCKHCGISGYEMLTQANASCPGPKPEPVRLIATTTITVDRGVTVGALSSTHGKFKPIGDIPYKLTPGAHKFDLWSDGTMTLHDGAGRTDVEIVVHAKPTMTPQSPLTPFGEILQSLRHGLAKAATGQRRDSEPVESPVAMRDRLARECRDQYFDAVILAARKRRARASYLAFEDREDGRTWDARQAEHDRAQMLDSAMSQPLDFSVAAYKGPVI